MRKSKKRLVACFLCLVMIFLLMPSQDIDAVTKTKISKCTVKLSKTSFLYTGKACKPIIKIKNKSRSLKEGKDFTVKYSNNIKPGTSTVVVSGKGSYTGSVKRTFKIKNALSVTLSKTRFDYSGNACKPTVKVKSGAVKLTSQNYSLTYRNNTKVGEASVIVMGKGKYKGKNAYVTFVIEPSKITDTVVTEEYSLSETTKTIQVGDNTACIMLNGYREGLRVKVTSTNELICATYNSGGKIELYGRDPASATITVEVGGKTLTCEVTAVMQGGEQGDQGNIGNNAMGDITQYIGEAWGISWNDTFNERMGLPQVEHSKIVYSSDDEAIVTVEPMPIIESNEMGVTKFQNGDVYMTFVGPGETMVRAMYEYEGKQYEQTLKVTSLALDDKYMSVSWNENNTYNTDYTSDSITGYAFGRKANSVLGQVSLEGANSTTYNNPSGFTTYKKDGVLYVFVTDAWNNRVMIYSSSEENATILDAVMNREGKLKEPVFVLGQKDAKSSTPGCGVDNLCWAMDCEVDSRGRLYVADTNNGRILVWDDIVSKIKAGVYGVPADHSIGWISSDHTDTNNHLNWVWALEVVKVDEDGDGVAESEKMVVTSTGNGSALIWNQLPEVWEEYSDNEKKYTTPHYYPDLVFRYKWGDTPRTITWTGKQLLIGDEGIDGYVNHDGRGCGIRVINGWPTKESIMKKGLTPVLQEIATGEDKKETQYEFLATSMGDLEDYCTLEDYGEGVMVDGKLYFGSSMAIQVYNDGSIHENQMPDMYIGKQLNNSGITGDTSGWFGYAPTLTGGLQKMIYEENTGRLYAMMHFGGGIVCWDNAKEQMAHAKQSKGSVGTKYYACPFPDYRVRDVYYDYDTKKESASVQNIHSPIVDTDGQHLVVLDDLDQQLRIYKNIPTNSGALPDYSYNLQFESGDIDLYTDKKTGKTTMMLTARTQNILYIWNDYQFDGALPDMILSKGIGGIYFMRESFLNVEYDGTYTYLRAGKTGSQYQILVYKGIPTKQSKPIAYIDGSSTNNSELMIDCYHGQVTSNGDYVSIVPDRSCAMILKTAQLAAGTEATPVYLTRDDASIVDQVNYGEEIIWDYQSEDGLNQKTNDSDGEFTGNCKGNHFNLYTDENGKTYHIRNVFYGAIDSLITEDGKYIVCDGGEWEVIIWSSVEAAIRGDAPESIIGRSQREYDFDAMAGIYNYHERRLATFDDALAMPYYLAYDGTNLWVGEFKFSNRLLRFNLT